MNKKITLLVLIVSITNAFSQNLNFINKADKLIARSGSSSAKQFGGNIYISNGFSATSTFTSEIEKYNPSTNTWSLFTTSTPSIAKQYGNSEIASGNTLCLFNGLTSTGAINDKIEKINLTTGVLTVSAALNPNPVYAAGSEYFSLSLLSFGGCSDRFNAIYSKKFNSFYLSNDTWTALPDMPVGLETKGKMLFGGGENLYVFGGYKETNSVAENFETLTVGSTIAVNNWLNVAETGTKLYRGNTFNSNKYAEISAFTQVVANQEASNKAWLISNPLTALSTDQIFLNFDTKDGYNNGATLEPYLITNWTGNIATSTKVLLYGNIAYGSTAGIATNFTNSGNILLYGDLSNFRIAFKYTGGYTPVKTTTYQIDKVRVYKATVSNNIYKYSFSDGSNAWVTLNTLLPQSLSAYAIASDSSAKAYITGDYNNQTFTGVFDAVTETFTTLTQTNMIGRRHHNSEIWNNNLYIMGGNTDSFIGSVLASTQSADLSTLSSNDFKANEEFRVFPNPVKDILNLSYDTTINTVSIYNVLGQEMLRKSINANEGSIDVSSLSSGTYMIKVSSNDFVKTLKVIKE
jgi:N-acetylneuraminic acid mutarotase